MTKIEGVAKLVHEGRGLLVQGAHVVPDGLLCVAEVERSPAPERDHEVVAPELGAARGSVEGTGLVVHEQPVAIGEALRIERTEIRWIRRRCAAFRRSPEELRLEDVEIGVYIHDWRGRARREGGLVAVRYLVAAQDVESDPRATNLIRHRRGGEGGDDVRNRIRSRHVGVVRHHPVDLDEEILVVRGGALDGWIKDAGGVYIIHVHTERQVPIDRIVRPSAGDADSGLAVTPQRSILPAIREPIAIGVQRSAVRCCGVSRRTRYRKRERGSQGLADGPSRDVNGL